MINVGSEVSNRCYKTASRNGRKNQETNNFLFHKQLAIKYT